MGEKVHMYGVRGVELWLAYVFAVRGVLCMAPLVIYSPVDSVHCPNRDSVESHM